MSKFSHWPEMVSGAYGGLATRSRTDYRFWLCMDSDYSWTAVVDDYGNLVPVSSYQNDRGY